MAGFSRTQWVNCPPEIVFEFATNPENSTKVIETVQETKIISDGGMREGARLRETRLMDGKPHTAEMTVTRYKPSTGYAVLAEDRGILVEYAYAFHAENGGTRIDLEATVTAKGLKKLALPLVVASMKKLDGDHLDHLKTAIESSYVDSSLAAGQD